jgi:hypothetical protein
MTQVLPSWAQLIAGHDRGLSRGVLHGFEWRGGGGLGPPLFQEARHRGSASSRHDNTMIGGRSGHSGHDDGSTTGIGTMTGHRPPLRVTACFLGDSEREPVFSKHMLSTR